LHDSFCTYHSSPQLNVIARPPPRASHPHGLFSVSIPRALVQALRIEKGETLEWVIEDGEIVLKRLGMLKK